MTHQDDLQPAGMPEDQPTMELLEGAEQAAPSLMRRLVRGSLYGVLLLSATTLLAISAVPELANYATFIPDTKVDYQCSSQSSGCCGMKLAAYEDTPCSSHAEAVASAGGCSSSCEEAEMLAKVAAGLKSCCPEESLATDVQVVDEAPPQTLLTDEQLALLPAGEDLD